MFWICSRIPCSLLGMTDETPLKAAAPEDIVDGLAFALRFEGRRRVHHADDAMSRITADLPVRHLERSGFVLMKRPLAPLPRA